MLLPNKTTKPKGFYAACTEIEPGMKCARERDVGIGTSPDK